MGDGHLFFWISEWSRRVCVKACALGKHAKETFPHNETKSTRVLDLVHSDICGPMLVESIMGFNYFMANYPST